MNNCRPFRLICQVFLAIATLITCFAACGKDSKESDHTPTPDKVSSPTSVQIAGSDGGEISSGADSFRIGPAYFISSDLNRKISLCYEIAPGFGATAKEVDEDIRWSFKKWANYIEAKDLHYGSSTSTLSIIGNLGTVHEHCTGQEDLRVYLGVNHPDVEKFRPRYLRPYAFSAITDTDADKNWNRGILYLAGPGEVDSKRGIPVWNNPEQVPGGVLRYVIEHEVGHIFGNGHIDSTVMTGRIGQWLKLWTDPANPTSGPAAIDLEIDQAVELVPNLNLPKRYVLEEAFGFHVVNGNRSYPNPTALEKTFERIFGQRPVGSVSATAFREEKKGHVARELPDHVETGTGPVTIEFNDDQGPHRVQVITTAILSESRQSTPLFNGQNANHYHHFGMSMSGYIDVNGAATTRIPVVVNFNQGNGLKIIEFGRGSSEQPLLTSIEGGRP